MALSAKECRMILKKELRASSDRSFATINIFLNVLADQLKKLSASAFFRTARISDMVGDKTIPIIRSSVVNALILFAKEFSSRSVSAYRSTQQQTLAESSDMEGKHERDKSTEINADLASAASNRVESMIRWDDSNHLIFVFHSQNIHTISPMYRDISKVPIHIRQLFEGQLRKPLPDFSQLKQEQLQDILQKIARPQPSLPSDELKKLAKYYALTPDNLLKMVLIMLRIQARIPVIIMGETGCGKTSLIRYMASVCEIPFDVISIHAGIDECMLIERINENNRKAGQNISSERWVFFDEINTSESIGFLSEVLCHHCCLGRFLAPNLVFMAACNPYKLRSSESIFTSGLKGKVETDELSRLVYRVHPLPEMLVDYVWDFGSLSDNDEKLYIDRMVTGICQNPRYEKVFIDLLAMSQSYTRQIARNTSCVSLRDVQRCKILFCWFHGMAKSKTPKRSFTLQHEREITSIILSLAHCYQSRFSKSRDRKEYRKAMQNVFVMHKLQTFTEKCIHTLITEEQKDILSRMELPAGTAENVALQENVFVLLVCILTRIPIFLVGKPGCSKSLSMQVIKSNLRGKDSKDEFFKKLPQLYCVSFQGSESSTSDGIIKVFEKAENYQNANSNDDVLSVVLLDEIGLAEVSRFNPLKVLHNLLEPNGQNPPNVAVVGISNWCLDESKMNRAVHLSRPEMDLEELHETAISISESFESNEMSVLEQCTDGYRFKASNIHKDLKQVSLSYENYIRAMRFESFHGLRDYYSLVKYFTRELSIMSTAPAESDIRNKIALGVQRNFGGLPEEFETLTDAFNIADSAKRSVMELIKDNMEDNTARHIMLITTGESIIGMLEKELDSVLREKREIIFGSQFEEDLTDDYNYRILSRIILCMEQGVVLILKDLENIYGSLYDMLNQNYTEIGKKKLCRVALGAYSNPFCHVHENFKCIVLVDKKDIKYSDPPFLNRFEKHYLNFSDITGIKQKAIISKMETWIDWLVSVDEKHVLQECCFPVYSKDMVESLVLKIDRENLSEEDVICRCKTELLHFVKPEVVVRLGKRTKYYSEEDASHIREFYFGLPLHQGLAAFIEHQLLEESDNCLDNGMQTIVFTSSSVHSKSFQNLTPRSHHVEKLGAFKSEKSLSLQMQRFWLDSDDEILFLVCSAGNEKHFMLAKSVIERYKKEFTMRHSTVVKHVYFIIHIDRNIVDASISSAVNYLSGWDLIMLDSIEKPAIPVPQYCKMTLKEAIMRKRPMDEYIQNKLLWSFSRIKYPKHGRTIDSFARILDQMKHCEEFIELLDDQIYTCILNTHPNIFDTDWQVTVSCDVNALQTSCTFVEALENYVQSVIEAPLAKYIFKMENANILDSFFVEDKSKDDRRMAWKKNILKETLFSIADLPHESGPESYICENKEIFLKLPFSMHIFNAIETTREEFMNSVSLLRIKCDIDEEDDLPEEILALLMSHQECVILQKVPDLLDFLYNTDDYVHDFCNILSYTTCSSLDHTSRIDFMRMVVKHKVDVSVTFPVTLLSKLHACYWMNCRIFYGVLNLLEYCLSEAEMGEEIIAYVNERFVSHVQPDLTHSVALGYDNQVSSANGQDTSAAEENQPLNIDGNLLEKSKVQSDESPKEYDCATVGMCEMFSVDKIVDFVCKQMLPTAQTINSNEEVADWHRKAHTVLTLASVVSYIPESVNALRLCYDICAEVIIPGHIDYKWLCKLSKSFSDSTIDSPVALDAFMQLYTSLPGNDVSLHENCLKMLSKMCVKCMYRSRSTPAIPFIISCLQKGTIPDNYVWVFKPPLQLAIQLVWADNPTLFTWLLQTVHNDMTECSFEINQFSQTGEDQQDEDRYVISEAAQQQEYCNYSELETNANKTFCENEDYEEENVIFMLDRCVKHKMNTDQQQYLKLTMLIVDLLEEIYDELEEGDDEKRKLLLQSHKCMTLSSGFQTLACIAFSKQFLKQISTNLQASEISEETKQCLKVVFRPVTESNVSDVLAGYFLKTYANATPLSLFYKQYIHLKKLLGDLGNIEWRENDFLSEFEMCPLQAFIPIDNIVLVQNFLDTELDKVPLKDRVKSILSESKTASSARISLFAIAMKYFYLVRPFEDINDTRREQASLIVIESHDQNLDQYAFKLLQRFLGKQDFDVQTFMIQEGSGSMECILSSWMTTLYSLLIAHNRYSGCEAVPFIVSCLFEPISVKKHYFPGFPDEYTESEAHSKLNKPFIFTCDCGFRLAIFTTDKLVCNICKRDISGVCSNEVTDVTTFPRKGYVPASTTRFSQIRHLCPASYNILQLMIKSCLLGSVALGFCDRNTLMQTTSLEEIDVVELLWKESLQHWKNLSKTINVDDATTSLVLYSIMRQAIDLICKNTSRMDSWNARNEWEVKFEESVQCVLRNPFELIKDMLQTFHNNTKSTNSAELLLREAENVAVVSKSEKVHMQSLFRLTGSPNEISFIQSVVSESQKCHFLVLVIQRKNLLGLPKYMLGVIQWHIAVTSKINYLLKKQELSQMTVADFIRKFGEKDPFLKSRFTAFQSNWNEMRESLLSSKLMSNVDRVHFKTNIADCLYLCEESIVYKVLQVLVWIQNDFLDSTLRLGQECESISFLQRGESAAAMSHVEITEVNKQNLINLKLDFEEMLTLDAQCNLEYHKGRQIQYDMRSIEKDLAHQLLVGKVHIGLESSLPRICFTDELFQTYTFLMNGVKESVPQENLPHNLQSSIMTNHENDPKMATELLTYVGMAITWLKKTKGDPQRALVEYIDSWKGVFTETFPKELLPSPQNSLLLCHIVALHELLEELCSDSILDSLEDAFRQELDIESETVLKALVKCNPKAADILRRTLKRFVYRCLTFRDAEADTIIMVYLTDSSFWPDGVKVEGGIQVSSSFIPMDQVIPCELTVGHIHWTMTTLEHELKTLKQKDMKISKIASSYQSKTKQNDKDIRRKKVLRGFKKKS